MRVGNLSRMVCLRNSMMDRYEFDNAVITLWSSQDLIVLKLITLTLKQRLSNHIPRSCYHIGPWGIKKGRESYPDALSEYQFVMRSDIKGYYESIRFDVLMEIIEVYIDHPILLSLIGKALFRTETRGGLFYDFDEKGIPMGSPLSLLLGAIVLIPLDKAIGRIKDVFYARYMDDWVVLTKSKKHCVKLLKSLTK